MADIWPEWQRMKENGPRVIVDALGITQNNVSIALSCPQAQLQVQSTAAIPVREGDESASLSTEIQNIIWENNFSSKNIYFNSKSTSDLGGIH